MRTLYLPFLVASFLFFAGCAKHAAKPVEQDVVTNENTPLETQIAHFIGESTEGSTQTFYGTRYGQATVTVGRSYQSALNIPCKEASIQGTIRSRTAACKDTQRGWILAPDIMGDEEL